LFSNDSIKVSTEVLKPLSATIEKLWIRAYVINKNTGANLFMLDYVINIQDRLITKVFRNRLEMDEERYDFLSKEDIFHNVRELNSSLK
jgi:hypothetical protein